MGTLAFSNQMSSKEDTEMLNGHPSPECIQPCQTLYEPLLEDDTTDSVGQLADPRTLFHPQIDGQGEANIPERQHGVTWDPLDSLAAFAYGGPDHASINSTPFEYDPGYTPSVPVDPVVGVALPNNIQGETDNTGVGADGGAILPPPPRPPPPPHRQPKEVVECIMDHKRAGKKQRTFKYFVKWKGLSVNEGDWLTKKELKNSKKLVDAYHREKGLKPVKWALSTAEMRERYGRVRRITLRVRQQNIA
ncbi:hypothetical protein EV426DRAFT_646320 [Tirmania nivea]|nr:hypothetical protein EV426DRAFT_646320 [Tirmania nivea]